MRGLATGMEAADDAALRRWREMRLRDDDDDDRVQTSSQSHRRTSSPPADSTADASTRDCVCCSNTEPQVPVLDVSDERPSLDRSLRRFRIRSPASGYVDCSVMDRVSCCVVGNAFNASETWCALCVPFSRLYDVIARSLQLSGAAVGTVARLQHTTFRCPNRSDDVIHRLPISRFSRTLLVVAILVVMVTSHGSFTMAAPTSGHRSQSSRASRVFDGDAGADKTFDGTTYLMQFGYLPSSDLETGALRSEEELRKAIERFQRVAGLRQTGRIDQQTISFMRKPRCGMADLLMEGRWSTAEADEQRHGQHRRHRRNPSQARNHERHLWEAQPFTFGPSRWNKTQLTFRFVNFTPDLLINDVRDAIYRALRVWSDASQLTFHEVPTGRADIDFQFATGYHHDGYPFDGPGIVLAHAFFPGEDRGGDVHFDDDEKWSVYKENGVDLFMVAAHELGHALGLAHSTVPGSLMFPWHQGYSSDFQLHEDDAAAIQQLYGAPHSYRPPPRSRPVDPATRPTPTTNTPRMRVTSPARRPSYDHPEGGMPDPCHTNFDAVSVIRGEIFAFKGKWFWRMTDSGVMEGHPVEIARFWYGLPPDLDHVDAVYERTTDGHIVFFSGRRYWSCTGLERSPTGGRPLSDFGLPGDIDRVDAVFVWGHNRRTYVIAGGMYWRLGAEEHSTLSPVEIHGYPRDMSMWAGVPLPVDSAFTHSDGKTYFFKGREYWEFNNVRMHVQHVRPRLIGRRWLHCARQETDDEEHGHKPNDSGPSNNSGPSMDFAWHKNAALLPFFTILLTNFFPLFLCAV